MCIVRVCNLYVCSVVVIDLLYVRLSTLLLGYQVVVRDLAMCEEFLKDLEAR